MTGKRMNWLVLVAATVLVSACGGGGGGGDDGAAVALADAAYTGVRTQAYIDANNAESLVLGAYGELDYGGIIPLSTESPAGIGTAGANDPYGLAIVFNQAAAQVRQKVQVQPLALLDPAQECLNYPAGTLSDTLVESVTDTTDTLSGTISYSNCDVGGATLNGTVSLTASIDLATFDVTLAMTMNPLGYDDGLMSYTLTGDLSGSETTNASGYMVSHLVFNLTVDDLAGHTYWLNNYVIDETEEPSGLRSTMRGRYYDNDYGYVDFVTDPLDTIFVPFNPTDSTYDGRLDFTGSSSSRATLWLGVNQSDYCINVFNASGVVDIGTCAR